MYQFNIIFTCKFINLKYLFFILFTFILFSCEEDYIINDDDFKPSIVLNSVFTEDNVWVIKLNTSKSIYNEKSISVPIDDATIIISEPSGVSECMLTHQGNGEYISSGCFPRAEKKYNITIFSPKYGTVTSSSSIPKKAKITVEKAIFLEDETIIAFKVEEQSQLEDYYIWDLVDVAYTENPNPSLPNITREEVININIWVDNLSNEINDIKRKNLTASVSSIGGGVAGSTFSETIITRSDRISTGTNPDSTSMLKTKTMLRVMTVSKELYDYFKSIENYLGYKDYNSSFHEPNTVFNNIKGGVGIFAGYSVEYADISQ